MSAETFEQKPAPTCRDPYCGLISKLDSRIRPLTHCSSCGHAVRRDTIWGWTGHTWECPRIGKPANAGAR